MLICVEEYSLGCPKFFSVLEEQVREGVGGSEAGVKALREKILGRT